MQHYKKNDVAAILGGGYKSLYTPLVYAPDCYAVWYGKT